MKRAVPIRSVIPERSKFVWLRPTISATTARFRSRTPIGSAPSNASRMPNSAARRASSATLADLTSVLVGMQATLMQVPPIIPFSTMTTGWPADAIFAARVLPPFPPPTTAISKCSAGMVAPFLRVGPRPAPPDAAGSAG